MLAAGYEVLNKEILVASSLGVLVSSQLGCHVARSCNSLPVAEDRHDAWVTRCLKRSNEEPKGIHAIDIRHGRHEAWPSALRSASHGRTHLSRHPKPVPVMAASTSGHTGKGRLAMGEDR